MEQKYKILIADDDEDVVKVIRARLESEGFDTLAAYEGVQTVELAHHEHPDLLLLDWKMPVGKGDAVLKYLREREDTHDLPIIIITGTEESNMEKKAFHSGVKAIIRKPYDPKILLLKIREVLKERAQC